MAAPLNPNWKPASEYAPQDYISQFLYPGGQTPTAYKYKGLLDETGKLRSEYGNSAEGLKSLGYDSSALDKLTGMATSDEASPWARIAMDLNKANTANQMGAADVLGNTALSTARSSMASRGGLRQGAAFNLANMGAKNLMAGKQGVLNQSNLNELGILGNDAQNKMGMLGQAVQGQGQRAGIWGNVVSNQNQGENAYNANIYNQNMKAWAADKQATADTEAAKHSGGLFGGGGFLGLGSWICTEVDKLEKLPEEITSSLRALREDAVVMAPGRMSFYLNGAGGLLKKMKNEGYDFGKERAFVLAVAVLHGQDPKAAVEMYWDRVCELMKEWGV